MGDVNLETTKIIHAEATNLNDIIFTIEVNEGYFDRFDEYVDLASGLEFMVVDRPHTTLHGTQEIKCRLLTEIDSLKFLRNTFNEEFYAPGYVTYMGEVKDERTEV